MAPYVAQAWAIARKDLLLEARSRERFVSMATFAALVAVVFSFALDPTVRSRDIAGAMLWVTVLFAGTLGLGRSFAMEREADALTGVLVSPVPRGAVFLGKFLANLVVVLAVEAVIFPVYAHGRDAASHPAAAATDSGGDLCRQRHAAPAGRPPAGGGGRQPADAAGLRPGLSLRLHRRLRVRGRGVGEVGGFGALSASGSGTMAGRDVRLQERMNSPLEGRKVRLRGL
jgi:hypothetical protein